MKNREILIATALLLLNACTQQNTSVPQNTVAPTASPVFTLAATEPPRPTYTATPEPCVQLHSVMPPEDTNRLLITYINERDVWLWDSDDCTSQQLTDFGNVDSTRLVEDGKTIIFERIYHPDGLSYGGTAEVWAMETDGANQRLLIDSSTFEEFYKERNIHPSNDYEFLGMKLRQVIWIPETKSVAFSTKLVFTEFPDASNDLRLLDFETGELSTIFEAGEAGNLSPSPNGEKIIITTPESISIYDLVNRQYIENIFTYESVLCYCEGRWYAKPKWSSDSRSFMVGIPPRERLELDAEITVWSVNVDDRTSTKIGSYLGEDWLRFTEDFSPNLEYFVIYQKSTFSIYDLGLSDKSEPLAEGEGAFISWNPNSHSYFITMNEGLFYGSIQDEAELVKTLPTSHGRQSANWINESMYIYYYSTGGAQPTTYIAVGSISDEPINVISTPKADFWDISFDFEYLP